ncbi:MAG: type I-A CRISPR-associated protein Cas4/Csa1 [Candidatus Thorarchaeota archaeon]|nr:type I-A CRISPR-associated protein Cas4/Csa1 [Candidatus Thorarchaeota archaeon]
MFLLSSQFKHKLQRRRLEGTNSVSRVDERLRGGAWRVYPLRTSDPITIPVSDISERYCETMRNIFIRHVMGIEPTITGNEYDNFVVNEVITRAYEYAKRELYNRGAMKGIELKDRLDLYYNEIIDSLKSYDWNEEESLDTRLDWIRAVWNKITDQIESAIDNVLEEQPQVGADALVNAALPIIISDHFAGIQMGLTESFSSYIWMPEHAVINLRMGKKRLYHRLATVASAIFAEKLYDCPIDIGCIVYAKFNGTEDFKIKYETFNIGDLSRREFIDIRNKALHIIRQREDPGIATFCLSECPYYHVCHGTIPD